MSASTRSDTRSGRRANADAIFGRIVVGIDGTEAGFAACRQVAHLAVVGSRGLHGVKALGSVSERVAHDAACSVLVVRRAPSHDESDEAC